MMCVPHGKTGSAGPSFLAGETPEYDRTFAHSCSGPVDPSQSECVYANRICSSCGARRSCSTTVGGISRTGTAGGEGDGRGQEGVRNCHTVLRRGSGGIDRSCLSASLLWSGADRVSTHDQTLLLIVHTCHSELLYFLERLEVERLVDFPRE